MKGAMVWNGVPVPFLAGDSVANALMRHGIVSFGTGPTGQSRSVFCGIGLCQSCLIRANGHLTEACLLPARAGLNLTSETGATDV
ncbi:2Fe-2S iron-sulfur cluster-binding protein [Pseudotabrizicola sp.]|uniref:2Fe-2S iron-sulfur cluster-binding protein n=1 Tax=Pseudotabrizicola sp. TaxID=2939647 RepID=UPI00351E4CF5